VAVVAVIIGAPPALQWPYVQRMLQKQRSNSEGYVETVVLVPLLAVVIGGSVS
jgi:hypothetical protein